MIIWVWKGGFSQKIKPVRNKTAKFQLKWPHLFWSQCERKCVTKVKSFHISEYEIHIKSARSAKRLGRRIHTITAVYVQSNCEIYFFGPSFFSSGFAVGSLNVSGFLSTPGPTCCIRLVPLEKWYIGAICLPPTQQFPPRSFGMLVSTLMVPQQFSFSPHHIEFPCTPSEGSPFVMGVHQNRSPSWYVSDLGGQWRRHQIDRRPLAHTSLLHRTDSWCWELGRLRLRMSWLGFENCGAHSTSCKQLQISALEWESRRQWCQRLVWIPQQCCLGRISDWSIRISNHG